VAGLKVAVLGAGIGGLAAARALALRGACVTVLEQAPDLLEVGAGIQISPNGMAVLRGLGLEEAVRASGAVPLLALSLRAAPGDEVLRMPLGGASGRDHLACHRADLIEVLATGARAAGVRLRLLHRVTDVVPGAPAEVVTGSAALVRADLVVGADGINSVLRPILNTAAAPRFTGQVAWRAVVPADATADTGAAAPEARLWMGPGRHVVSYPLRGGTMRNIVAVEERRAWTAQTWSQRGDPAAMAQAFRRFGPEVRELLARVEEPWCWGLFRHPVAARWTGSGTALLGDAAHPTLPFMAQGANLALEDAWVLAQALDEAASLDAGLTAYAHQRRSRALRVVDAASRNAWKFHLRLPPLRVAAHLALRIGGRVAPEAMARQFDWIYRHDVTGGERLPEDRLAG